MKLNGGNLTADVERIVAHRSRRDARAGRPGSVRDWKYLLDFNEGCPERRVPDRGAAAGARGHAARLRPDSLHRAADQSRSEEGSRQRHARGRAAASGRRRRVADRSRDAAAGARDGLHRRRAQGVQGPDARDADGGGRAEVRPVPVRAGPDVPGRVVDPFGRHRGARARQRRHRSQRAPVRARRPTRRGRRDSLGCSPSTTA